MTTMTNDQPIVGATGDVYSAPVGTPIPSDVENPGSAWTKLGLISEDGVSWTPPAEETTDIKVWQSPYPARTVTTGLSSSMSFAMDEWDRESLTFALGGGSFDDTTTPGITVYKPPQPGESLMKALFVKVLDGDVKMGVYFQKGKVTSREDTTFKSDEAALLGVEFSLQAEAGKDPFNLVFDSACFPPAAATPPLATGATAGIPGSFTPGGSTPPADLPALQASSIVASPTTAWTTGQYVVLGDNSHAFWDSDSYEVGAAP